MLSLRFFLCLCKTYGCEESRRGGTGRVIFRCVLFVKHEGHMGRERERERERESKMSFKEPHPPAKFHPGLTTYVCSQVF